jgi:YD repeat-containing protein
VNRYDSMVRLTIAAGQAHTGGANNGQIANSGDGLSGETVTYQYDALKRLLSASAAAWSESYSYDGFGNLTGMAGTGGAPTLSVGVDWTTNRITPSGIGYDSNGNVTYVPAPVSATLGYDAANRVVSVNGTQVYAYDQGNRRVYYHDVAGGVENVYLYGLNGEKLARYEVTVSNAPISFALGSQNVYFGGEPGERGRQRGGGGPVGLGALVHHGEPHVLSLRGGIHGDSERHGEVRDVHAGHADGAGLCGEPVLFQHLGAVYVARPIWREREAVQSAELESV